MRETKKDLAVAKRVLNEIGMYQYRGYWHILLGIRFMQENPGTRLHKEVYPQISKITGDSVWAIEKSIRDSISATWETADAEVLEKHFQKKANGKSVKLTNGEFLRFLAYKQES